MGEYFQLSLDNGIRAIHKEIAHTKIAHVGIMLDIGSRDEKAEEQGLAHFWEHMAFKGTQKRKSFHIINRLESLGGELNAYTTKEKICFYASVLDKHIEKAIELLVDITFNSTFPEKQIEKERQVILEEMAMYRDTPEDAIIDEFDEIIFKDHSLGRNILGNEDTVRSFHRSDFRAFVDRNLDTSKVVFSTVGNVKPKKLERLARKYLSDIASTSSNESRNSFETYSPNSLIKRREISQGHFLMGLPSFHLKHPDRIPFFLLTNILGGPAMNSKLNLSLREKHGLVYGVEAHFSSATDIGLFSLSFATDPKKVKKSKSLVEQEIKKLQTKKLGNVQLHTAKEQLKGQLAMSEENNNAVMLMMAKSLLDLEKVPSIDGVFEKIDNTSAEKIVELANEAIVLDQMSSLTFLPH